VIDLKLARTSVAAATATGADFCSVVALVSLLRVPPALATALGCLIGAVVNFSMNRMWAFESQAPLPGQVVRFGIVSGGSLLLNTGGVHLVVSAAVWEYKTGWWLVRGTVWLLWNYPLHRYWVFR
jgi:putative flippase GtrA